MSDEHGEKAQLKPGAEVDVIIEADSSATRKKPSWFAHLSRFEKHTQPERLGEGGLGS